MKRILSPIALSLVLITARIQAQESDASEVSKPASGSAKPREMGKPAASAQKAKPGKPASDDPAPESPLKNLSVGTEGLFRPGLLLQGWFSVEHADETAATFRLRRAEISVKGEIIPDLVGYGVLIDPAMVLEFEDKTIEVENQDPAPSDPDQPETVTVKQPAKAAAMFKDFFITFLMPYGDLSLGQFKIPVSWEGYNSSSKLLFAERALVSKEFGDKRDLGLQVTKRFEYLGYTAGIFNGATLNHLDNNVAKDAALRLELYPMAGLMLGGVIYASLWQRDQEKAKDRFEADARLATGAFLLQAEFLRSRDVDASGEETEGQGFYAAVAYKLIEVLEPCLRVGYLDPDANRNLDPQDNGGEDEVWHFDAGVNWYIRGHEAKLQLNYYRFQFEDKTANNEVLLAAQVAF
ncbi:MAG: hypothetical protein JXA30_09915 [Deltaproteobacteria bacterium]|nr:hypothetical protein [Deltaproteobacteria bacterium]